MDFGGDGCEEVRKIRLEISENVKLPRVSFLSDLALINLLNVTLGLPRKRYEMIKGAMSTAREKLESAYGKRNSSGGYCLHGLPAGNSGDVEGAINFGAKVYNELVELINRDEEVRGVVGELERLSFEF